MMITRKTLRDRAKEIKGSLYPILMPGHEEIQSPHKVHESPGRPASMSNLVSAPYRQAELHFIHLQQSEEIRIRHIDNLPRRFERIPIGQKAVQ